MAGNVLPDSSFYIDRLRDGEDPFVELAEYAEDCDFFTCGVVVAEVLRGIKGKAACERAASIFGSMLYVPTSNSIWEKVWRHALRLDREGKVMQVTDLVIAVSAMEADAAVVTLDSDFQRVPNLRVLRTLS